MTKVNYTDQLTDFLLRAQHELILPISASLHKNKVSFPQWFFLTHLAITDFETPTSIAKIMGNSTAAATGFVDRLEILGLVQRVHSSDDRRKTLVQITRRGLVLIESMRTEIYDNVATALAEVEKQKREPFFA